MTRWSQDMVTVMMVAVLRMPSRTSAHRQDRRLRRIDHRGEVLDAEHAKIGDGETAALVFLRLELLGARPLGQRLHLVGEDGQTLLLGTEHDGGDEAEIERYGDGDI